MVQGILEEKEKDKIRRQVEGKATAEAQQDERNQGKRTSDSAIRRTINPAYLLKAVLYFNLLTEFIVSPRA